MYFIRASALLWLLLLCRCSISIYTFLFHWERNTQNFAIVLKLINWNTDATDQIEIYIICHKKQWMVSNNILFFLAAFFKLSTSHVLICCLFKLIWFTFRFVFIYKLYSTTFCINHFMLFAGFFLIPFFYVLNLVPNILFYVIMCSGAVIK